MVMVLPFPWNRLVTVEQFRETLAPVLRMHLDPKVNLVSVAQNIQPNAACYTKRANGGRVNSRRKQKAKLNDRHRSSRGINKEMDVLQTDDNEDDSEDFDEKPRDSAEVKEEPDLIKEIYIGLVHERPVIPHHDRSD
jgi:hypothetical protein